MVKYCKPAPATLKRWIDKNADKVIEFDSGFGYGTDSGFAYDIFLAPGWRQGDDFVHTIIEETVFTMMSQLRNIVACDCDECKEALAKKESK
jgi:hypothetical protein